MEKKQTDVNGVLTNVVGAAYFEGGYASFDDAVKAMVSQWERLSSHERATIKGRGYRNNRGEDYMLAVGFYDEETGQAWEAMTLAEAMKAIEEEEEEE